MADNARASRVRCLGGKAEIAGAKSVEIMMKFAIRIGRKPVGLVRADIVFSRMIPPPSFAEANLAGVDNIMTINRTNVIETKCFKKYTWSYYCFDTIF